MQKMDIESLPEAVRKNLISRQEAANIIWEEVYTNPQKYGLMKLSEDQKSELLLENRKYFSQIFDKFIPGTTTFKTFLSGCIQNHKHKFLRCEKTRETERRTIDSFLISEIENETKKYSVSLDDGIPVKLPASKNLHTGKRERKIMTFTVLVLLLKACNDIDGDTIKSASIFTGIKESLLYEKIEKLKEQSFEKEMRIKDLVRRRNDAFFYRRKYMQELFSKKSSKNRIGEVEHLYQKQTRIWENHNKAISARILSPSNEEIAKIVGLNPRTVSFYINHAKNKGKIERMRECFEIYRRGRQYSI